jgi:hypothetical protein
MTPLYKVHTLNIMNISQSPFCHLQGIYYKIFTVNALGSD